MTTNQNSPACTKIGKSDTADFFLFNDQDVYHVEHGYILDNRGIPLGMRFERPKHLWEIKLSYSPEIVAN